ncbi:TolC family protein [Hyunsoonleella sp. SJ7]|uniref:TolC family protein n=1 Tax=Hyunsoonleella aquatilis TaxID=2762758 RepID=A0A923HD62_9FLAO|nr:TolC family protein [Hyunsoonleella aquatilis]MBC3757933.1 TolC family protein [Hyunsoonleella aquatilis]
MKSRIVLYSALVFLGMFGNAQQVLRTEDALKLALEHNYGIKIANNLAELAENNADILNSGYLPTLTGNAGATIDRQNTEGQLAPQPDPDNPDGPAIQRPPRIANGAETRRYNASLNLNYVLFDGLGRMYNYKRLKEEYQLSELDARETVETTIAQLFSIYYTVAQSSENTRILEQTLTISKDRLTRATYQFDYGQSTKLDVLNAEVDINNDSINLINAKQQLRNAKRDLMVVLGNKMPIEFDVQTDVSFMLNLDKEELLSKTRMNNIYLLRAEKNISISQFDVKASKAQFLPSVGLQGSYGWNETANNNNPIAFVLQSTSSGVSGGVNLTWNLFDGGTSITRTKNAKINLEIQELQKEQLLMDVERNFNNAWEDYQNKLTVLGMQEDNIITASNNFERTQEKFKLGQVNSIEFRQAQINLINAELNRNQAKYQAKVSELEVLRISGELLNVDF